ncbi:MAG: hypothetical protein HYS98_03865 [Deltaproteobacteria bacterium]|nr:hypothetical protein [Deltaproteobacteria bacterium]
MKSKWDTFFDVAGKFGRGALAGLAVGAEIYRPFMLNRQNKKIWNSWEKQSNFALAYGYPTPPYPVTAPIAPVNLGSIFNLMGVGHQPTYYERWMEGRYGQHSANGRQWSMQQMSQDYYQQLAYQQYMCQMQGGCGGGFPGWRGGMPGWGQNPFNQMQGNLNNIFTSLPQQIQSLQQMTGSLNEEIIYRRQAAENQLKQMEALQAQFDQLNKILPPLQGYLNRAGTVYGQMSRSAQDVFQGQGNYREEFIWNRGNNFQSNGRYGYGR